jgi:hypothetical protein
MRHILILLLGHSFQLGWLDEEKNIRKIMLLKIMQYILDWETVCDKFKGIKLFLYSGNCERNLCKYQVL